MSIKKIMIIQIIIVLSALLFVSPTIFSQDIHTILLKSVGGEKAVKKIESLQSIYTFGTFDMNGTLGEFDFKLKFPNKYILSITTPNYSIVQGYDGNIAWQKDISGKKTEVTGSEKRAILSNVYLNSFSYLFDDSLQNKKYIGIEKRNGNTYHKILFMPTADDTIITFYNIESDDRDYFITKQDMVEFITNEKSYQNVENIRTPFSTISTAKTYNLTITQTVKKIEFDKPFDDSIFRFQKESETSYLLAPQKKFSLKFEFQNGHIFLPVKLNGTKKVYMLLDSGASASILHLPEIAGMGLDSIGIMPAMGLSGSSQTQLVRVDSLQIGNLTIYNQIAGSLDLKQLVKTNINKVPFGGILGNDFLSQFPVLINYPKKEITIYNPQNYQAPPGGNHIPFEYYMLIPTIECEVASVIGKYIVDLGNAFGLILHHNFVKSNNISDKIKNKTKQKQIIGGVGGAIIGFEGILDSFKIGETLLLNEKVHLPVDSYGLSGSKEIAGNIGNALLKRYQIFFDYLQNELILYKNQDSQ